MNALPVLAMRLALLTAGGAAVGGAVAADSTQSPEEAVAVPRPAWLEPTPPSPTPAVQPDQPVLPEINDPPAKEPPVPVPAPAPAPAAPMAPPAASPTPPSAPSGRPSAVEPVRSLPPPAAPASVSAASRWTYVGGSVGQAQWNIEETQGISADGSSTALRLFVGHRYGPWWRAQLGAEAGFVDLGKATQDSVVTGVTRFKVHGLYLDGVLGQTLWPRVWVQGQAGLFYGRSDTQPGSSAGAVGLKWGVGAAYDLTPAWALRADWESYPVKAKETAGSSSSHLSVLTVGVRHRF